MISQGQPRSKRLVRSNGELYNTEEITSITELPYFPIIKEDIELRVNQAKTIY